MYKNKQVLLAIFAIIIMACVCGDSSTWTPTPMPTRSDLLPAVGNWVANTEFGGFRFVVRATGEIEEFYIFGAVNQCDTTAKLTWSFSSGRSALITDNAFSFTDEISKRYGSSTRIYRIRWQFDGTLASDLQSATGTWTYNVDGNPKCGGNWVAKKNH
jgi:hypothetical protein